MRTTTAPPRRVIVAICQNDIRHEHIEGGQLARLRFSVRKREKAALEDGRKRENKIRLRLRTYLEILFAKAVQRKDLIIQK